MTHIVLNEDGIPVMFAEVAPAGISRRDPDAKSGNPRHDIRSGKFAPGGGGARRGPTPPPNVDRAAYGRMLDAIREAAARYPGALTEENIQSFIAERAQNPEAVNLQAFLQAAHTQQMNDLVDILSPIANGPKLEAPRGYIQKVLRGMTDDDVAEIIQRIAARTGDEQKAAKLVIGKAPKERQQQVGEAVAATDFSDRTWDGLLLTDDAPPPPPAPEIDVDLLASQVAERIQIPPIEFSPNITIAPPGPTRKEVIRNESGLITNVVEVPVEST